MTTSRDMRLENAWGEIYIQLHALKNRTGRWQEFQKSHKVIRQALQAMLDELPLDAMDRNRLRQRSAKRRDADT